TLAPSRTTRSSPRVSPFTARRYEEALRIRSTTLSTQSPSPEPFAREASYDSNIDTNNIIQIDDELQYPTPEPTPVPEIRIKKPRQGKHVFANWAGSLNIDNARLENREYNLRNRTVEYQAWSRTFRRGRPNQVKLTEYYPILPKGQSEIRVKHRTHLSMPTYGDMSDVEEDYAEHLPPLPPTPEANQLLSPLNLNSPVPANFPDNYAINNPAVDPVQELANRLRRRKEKQPAPPPVPNIPGPSRPRRPPAGPPPPPPPPPSPPSFNRQNTPPPSIWTTLIALITMIANALIGLVPFYNTANQELNEIKLAMNHMAIQSEAIRNRMRDPATTGSPKIKWPLPAEYNGEPEKAEDWLREIAFYLEAVAETDVERT
ncbi:hypothetical protein H0H81_006324, partial [Sphagnurus paluster]